MQNIIFSLKNENIKLYVLYNSLNAEQLKQINVFWIMKTTEGAEGLCVNREDERTLIQHLQQNKRKVNLQRFALN